jgi:hypothetical protein
MIMAERTNRRGFLNKTLLGAVGAGAVLGHEENRLLPALQQQAQAAESSSVKPKPDIPAGALPAGKIGKVALSRLILGGNLIGGYAHGRDLIYVSKLFKAYNTDAKVAETMELAQACGINAIQLDPRDAAPVLKYNEGRRDKMQILMCYTAQADAVKTRDEIRRLVDKGVVMLHVHGGVADQLVMSGQIDVIAKSVEMVKAEGIPAGVSGHSLETTMACEKHNVNPDYYLKTFHLDRYWSATPPQTREEWCWYKGGSMDHDQYHDNMFCLDVEKTAAFMQTVKKPWVAFKVMAAGAITPNVAFAHAFRNGADFILAGMFDFQVEGDVRLAIDALGKVHNRKRPWCG